MNFENLFFRIEKHIQNTNVTTFRTAEGGAVQIPPAAGGNQKEKPPDWVVFLFV